MYEGCTFILESCAFQEVQCTEEKLIQAPCLFLKIGVSYKERNQNIIFDAHYRFLYCENAKGLRIFNLVFGFKKAETTLISW